MEQGRIKPKNQGNVCGHHQYPTIPAFITHMIQLYKDQNECSDEIEEHRIANQRHALFDDGICRRCALYITVNMENVLKNKKISSVNIYRGGIRINALHSYFHSVDEHYGGSNDLSLLIACLQYSQCSKVIFNRSNLWIHYLFQEFHATVSSLNYICKMVAGDNAEYAETQPQDLTAAFRNLSVCLLQIVRNLSDWKREHWALILTSKSMETCRFNVCLDFIKFQLEHGFYLRVQDEYGLSTMYSFLIFICCAVYEMKKKWFKRYNNKRAKYDIIKLQEWCQSLNSLKPLNMGTRNLELSFMYLGKPEFMGNMHDIIQQNMITVAHEKWQDMQCQREQCTQRRCCCKLKKCSSCKVVRYCSRRCQKRAWKAHKSECLKLRLLRQEKSDRMRKVHALFYPQ